MIALLKSIFSKNFEIDGCLVKRTIEKDDKYVYQIHTCKVNGFILKFKNYVSFLNLGSCSKFAYADVYLDDVCITHRSYHFPNHESPISSIRSFFSEFIPLLKRINTSYIAKLTPLFINSFVSTELNCMPFELKTVILSDKLSICHITFDLDDKNNSHTKVFSFISYKEDLFIKVISFLSFRVNTEVTHYIENNQSEITSLDKVHMTLKNHIFHLKKKNVGNFELVNDMIQHTPAPHYSINNKTSLLYEVFNGTTADGRKISIHSILDISPSKQSASLIILIKELDNIIFKESLPLLFKMINGEYDNDYYADEIISKLYPLMIKYAPTKEVLKALNINDYNRILTDDEFSLHEMINI